MTAPVSQAYDTLLAVLDAQRARYRLIDHPPEGATALVSALRGNEISQAAKCVVVMVKLTKKTKKYVLAVVPGNTRVGLDGLKHLLGGTYAAFASPDVAERLAGSPSGTILPFSFDPELELIADPGVLAHEELFFNAARLDRSLALNTADYVACAQPRVEPIADAEPTHPEAERT